MERSAMRGKLAAWHGPRISLRSIRATSSPFAIRYSLLALLLAAIPAAAQSPQQVERIATDAIKRLDLQTELPKEPERPRFNIKLPSEVLWVVIAIALGVLLYTFKDMIPILRAQQGGAWSGEDTEAGEVVARPPAQVLGAADELAAQGRYVEAMHVLLLQGLADIRARLEEQFADSLTSREILRSTKLSDAGRSSLRDIVNRVEWSYFGEHPAGEPDYVACRSSFNALAQALHGQAAQGSAQGFAHSGGAPA
jgi:hypothetical protein